MRRAQEVAMSRSGAYDDMISSRHPLPLRDQGITEKQRQTISFFHTIEQTERSMAITALVPPGHYRILCTLLGIGYVIARRGHTPLCSAMHRTESV